MTFINDGIPYKVLKYLSITVGDERQHSTGLEFVGHWSQRRDLRNKERTMATYCQNEDLDLYSNKAGRLLLGK